MFIDHKTYAAEVRDVFSGDDLVLFIDLGAGDLWLRKRFRLHGVATPNAVGQNSATDAGRIRGMVYDLLKRRALRVTVMSQCAGYMTGVVEIDQAGTVLNLNQFLIEKGYQFNRNKEQQ